MRPYTMPLNITNRMAVLMPSVVWGAEATKQTSQDARRLINGRWARAVILIMLPSIADPKYVLWMGKQNILGDLKS
ncbi:hypothetical protein DPMN_035992 [Dreissena polymorpha]|uniref:Uncharacterized protein n=1 Tax=Dreissena polymorpha TaxID=45954 RepID=A0A9D4MBR4_DREPO|nr:hypothetical protein DPMN_035992 [Dreissena polymorpha]